MTTTNTAASIFKSPSSSSLPSLYNRPLRISDILAADQDGFHHGDSSLPESVRFMDGSTEQRSCSTVHCSSPYQIVSRLLSALRWDRTKRVAKREKEREFDDRTVEDVQTINGQGSVDSVGQNGFNIGVGCGLLYVVAASRNELNKMAELRTQMETLLQSTKEELQKKETLSDANEVQTSPQTVTASSYVLQDSSTFTLSDESLKYDEFKGEEECVEGMDRLEAELESELERLQAQLDGEKLLNHSWRRLSIKVGIEETASKSYVANSGEVIDPAIDPEFECMDLQCGVSPYELERRLHELLESRQQEQIRELEAGLEYLKRKLLEKEFEVSWWKDTARLLSRHVAESTRVTSQRGRNSCISR